MVSRESLLSKHWVDLNESFTDRITSKYIVKPKVEMVKKLSGTSKSAARYYMNIHVEKFLECYYGATALEEWFKTFSEGAAWLKNEFGIDNPLWLPNFSLGKGLVVHSLTEMTHNCSYRNTNGAQIKCKLEIVLARYEDLQLCHRVWLKNEENLPRIVLRSKIKQMFIPKHNARSQAEVILKLFVQMLLERWKYSIAPTPSKDENGEYDTQRKKLCKIRMKAYFDSLTPFEWWLLFGETTNLTDFELLSLRNEKDNRLLHSATSICRGSKRQS